MFDFRFVGDTLGCFGILFVMDVTLKRWNLNCRQTVSRHHLEHGAHAEHLRRRGQGEEEEEENDPEVESR